MADINSLPTELLHQICTNLPLPSLISFGATSRLHHALSTTTLHALHLGIFPTKIHGLVSMLNSPSFEHSSSSLSPLSFPSAEPVTVTLPRQHSRSKDGVIGAQSRRASRILRSHGRSLRSLELSLWSLEPRVADEVTRLRRLQHLGVCLDHPHTRHRDLRPGFWREAQGSTAWNSLFNPPRTRAEAETLAREAAREVKLAPKPVLGDLRSLKLERAGVTDWQLQRLLEENPRVEELRLKKCSLLTDEFFGWLAGSAFAETLKVLHFEACNGETIDGRILGDLEKMVGLEELSLSACTRIPNDQVKVLAREAWPNLQHLALPQLEHVEAEASVEVDPAYK